MKIIRKSIYFSDTAYTSKQSVLVTAIISNIRQAQCVENKNERCTEEKDEEDEIGQMGGETAKVPPTLHKDDHSGFNLTDFQ